MSISPRDPTLATLLVDAIQSRLVDFRVMLPCKISKYNSSDGTVDVEILLRDQKPQPDGTVTLVTFPPVQDVPIAWERCGKGWLTLPLAQGDTGMLVFADRSLSNWAASNKGEVVDPKSLGMHNLDGAVFKPGLTPTSSPIPSPDTDNVVLHTETKLMLGEKGLTGDQRAAVSKLVKDEIKAVRDTLNSHITDYNTHTHILAISALAGAGGTGTAAPTLTQSAPPAAVGDVHATKVYVK